MKTQNQKVAAKVAKLGREIGLSSKLSMDVMAQTYAAAGTLSEVISRTFTETKVILPILNGADRVKSSMLAETSALETLAKDADAAMKRASKAWDRLFK